MGGGGCRGQTPRTALALAGEGALQGLFNKNRLVNPPTGYGVRIPDEKELKVTAFQLYLNF